MDIMDTKREDLLKINKLFHEKIKILTKYINLATTLVR